MSSPSGFVFVWGIVRFVKADPFEAVPHLMRAERETCILGLNLESISNSQSLHGCQPLNTNGRRQVYWQHDQKATHAMAKTAMSIVMPPTRLGSTQLKSCGFDSAFFLKNRESKLIHRLSARFSSIFDLSCGFDKSRG